jgi:hypothetical protein
MMDLIGGAGEEGQLVPSYSTRHLLPASASKYSQPLHVYPEEGNANAYRNIG